jgi:heme exporter protein A
MRLICEHLSLFRGERLVLRDFSAAVPAGGALVLMGANGAGKSSALRMLAGFARPDSGRLSFDGETDYAGLAALLGHQDALKIGLTALENLGFTAALSGRDPVAALADVDLAKLADVPARYLSAGQKHRLALARLTLTGAPLWLLDEPSVGLDSEAVAALGRLMAAHRARGGVIVASTHVALPLPDAGIVTL